VIFYIILDLKGWLERVEHLEMTPTIHRTLDLDSVSQTVVHGALYVGHQNFLILCKMRNSDTNFMSIIKSQPNQLQKHLETTKWANSNSIKALTNTKIMLNDVWMGRKNVDISLWCAAILPMLRTTALDCSAA